MVRLTRSADFSTSLRLVRPDLSDEENSRLYGARASQHGHNYRLELSVRGEIDPVTGMVMDLQVLKDVIEREIMRRFDHKDLNADTPYFEKHAPTPERFLLVIRDLLREALPPGMLDHIRLRQDAETWVEWSEPRSPA